MKKDTSLPRRKFVAGTLAAAAGGISAPLWATENPVPNPPDLLRVEDFEFVLGQEFTVFGSRGHRTPMVLEEVSRLHFPGDIHRPKDIRKQGFSLLFRAEHGRSIESVTHPVFHPNFGKFPLFLTETRIDDANHPERFEAVFN